LIVIEFFEIPLYDLNLLRKFLFPIEKRFKVYLNLVVLDFRCFIFV
jgi:hypothetical protein